MKRLAILSTHPIQYNAPLFRLLATDEAIDLKVFYSKKSEEVRFDKDFGREVVWDIPLTDGYEHESFEASSRPGQKLLVTAIEEFKPDALMVYGWNFPGHWSTMRQFKGRVPVWFRGDSTLLDPLPFWKKIMRKFLLTQVYRSVDRAFYVGEANKRYFLWAGLHEIQLTYAPHAVDNDYFMRDDEERRKQAAGKREELRIAPESTVFIFVGKLENKKQPEILGRAFRSLGAEDSHLIYIGSGGSERALKTEFHDCPNIHFVGFQNQTSMPIWYRVADVLCLPSKGPGETWGLAVNEAMACGCAAIVSDRVGCGEDLVCGEVFGEIFPHDSLISLTRLMEKMLDTRTEKTQIKQYIENWSLARIFEAVHHQLNALP